MMKAWRNLSLANQHTKQVGGQKFWRIYHAANNYGTLNS